MSARKARKANPLEQFHTFLVHLKADRYNYGISLDMANVFTNAFRTNYELAIPGGVPLAGDLFFEAKAFYHNIFWLLEDHDISIFRYINDAYAKTYKGKSPGNALWEMPSGNWASGHPYPISFKAVEKQATLMEMKWSRRGMASERKLGALLPVLENSDLKGIKEFLEQRGKEFLDQMHGRNLWESMAFQNRSVMEVATSQIKKRSDEIDLMVFVYYITHSEQAKANNMNLLHVLARNNNFNLLKKYAVQYPEMLGARFLDMTPVEMAIVNNFMIDTHMKHIGRISMEDKTKLLSRAE